MSPTPARRLPALSLLLAALLAALAACGAAPAAQAPAAPAAHDDGDGHSHGALEEMPTSTASASAPTAAS